MDKIYAVAFISIGRAVGFSGLAIFTVMIGLCFEPVLALRTGGILLLALIAALLLKAQFLNSENYRRSEAWLLLDSSDRPDERVAARIVTAALHETLLRFARWTAGVAALVWASAILMTGVEGALAL